MSLPVIVSLTWLAVPGNTAITARRKGAKVTGIDFTPQMLTQAKAEATLAEADDIKWIEGRCRKYFPLKTALLMLSFQALAICLLHTQKLL